MELLLTIAVAVLLLTAAGYAQYRIPYHTAGAKVALTRGMLILVGIGFGYVGAAGADAPGGIVFLLFLIGFGLVHTPAAIILFIKRERGAGRS
jgi:hypothetical protein